MYLTGFADEASPDLDIQIKAIKELGWHNIESRNVGDKNLTLISDAEFDRTYDKLAAAGIRVNCFGSGVANWAKNIADPPDSSYDEMRRAIPRMHRLGTKLIRVMSFKCPENASINDPAIEREVIARMKTIARMAEDGGVTCVHENCDNWGGRSFEHTLKLLDAIKSPAFKLVFDTGNPVFRKDVRGPEPYKYQDSLEFYRKVREFIVYVHIKDGRMADGTMQFTFAGEGDGRVREILTDLHRTGYDGGISIEPHLAAVFHDPTVKSPDEIKYRNFVEYGRRLENIVRQIGFVPNSA